jgi:asparagine synthase (glutamine-hydrolysing)
LDPLERAAGVVLGDAPAQGGPVPSFATVRLALEAVVVGALESAPCVVSFSGGRDSSAVLALAAHVARREGLALPIPVTFRVPDVPETQESDWQEQVIAHLGLTDWERMDLTTELDLLGEVACGTILEHGPLWPPNAYLHVPIFEKARGGVVLTGLDGDGLFGDWRWCHAQAVLHRLVPFHWPDVARIAFAFSPVAARRVVLGRRTMFVPDWLTPPAQVEFRARLVGRAASEPRRWDRRVAWHERSRALRATTGSLATLAGSYGVRVVHPLLDLGVVNALGRAGGAGGFGDRTSAMRTLFGDLLPAEIIERPSKAVFGGAVWRQGARDFAEAWDGSGVDHRYVDAERLAAQWREEHPVFHSWSLLHSAWAAAQGRVPETSRSQEK